MANAGPLNFRASRLGAMTTGLRFYKVDLAEVFVIEVGDDPFSEDYPIFECEELGAFICIGDQDFSNSIRN